MAMMQVDRICPWAMDIAVWGAKVAEAALTDVALAVWARVQPAQPHPWVASTSPTDNLQRPMNLIMPLATGSVLERGRLGKAIVKATDTISVGLNNVGTVHFARFDIIAGNLCMISIYDGEPSGYIRDFITVLGEAFDAILEFVKEPPPTPVSDHPDEFIAWVAEHDAFQFPDESTDLLPVLGSLEREALLVHRSNRNVQLGIYRGYPGYSAAQIRQSLGIGW